MKTVTFKVPREARLYDEHYYKIGALALSPLTANAEAMLYGSIFLLGIAQNIPEMTTFKVLILIN